MGLAKPMLKIPAILKQWLSLCWCELHGFLETHKSLKSYASSFSMDKTFVQEILSKTKLKLSGTKIFFKMKKMIFPVKILSKWLFRVEYTFLSKEQSFWMTFIANHKPFSHEQNCCPRQFQFYLGQTSLDKSFVWAEGRGNSFRTHKFLTHNCILHFINSSDFPMLCSIWII